MQTEEAEEDPLNLLDRDIVGGLELWFSDGTESGTQPIIINSNLYEYYAPTDYVYGYIPDNLYYQDYGLLFHPLFRRFDVFIYIVTLRALNFSCARYDGGGRR